MASGGYSKPRFQRLPKPQRPTFQGLFTEDVEAFIENANAYFELEHITYRYRLSHLWTMILDPARQICKAKRPKNVDTLYSHLRNNYGGPWYTVLGKRELFEDCQRDNESNSCLVQRKMCIIKRFSITKHDFVTLLRGQFRPANPLWSFNKHITDLETLLQAAIYIDNNKKVTNENKSCRIEINQNCPLNQLIHPSLCKSSDGGDQETPKRKSRRRNRRKSSGAATATQSQSQVDTHPPSRSYDEVDFEKFCKKMSKK